MDVACGTPSTSVPGEHHVLRLSKDDPDYLVWSAELGRWLLKVPGTAIQFNQDLSTFWCEHLSEIHEAGAESILEPPPGRTLAFRANIAEMLALGLTIRHTPTASTAPACAHASFDRPALNKPARTALSLDISMLMSCVAGTITQPPPSGA